MVSSRVTSGSERWVPREGGEVTALLPQPWGGQHGSLQHGGSR